MKRFVVFLVILLCAGALFYWFITTHSFSARAKPYALEELIAENLRFLAYPPEAHTAKNPLRMTELELAEARDHYADHCAVCHNNNGDGKTMINDGLYPPAPDLRDEDTQEMSDGEIFYIIKNGIRFTGMPGWGGSDDDNWKLVGFIRHLPQITSRELEFMREINQLEIDSNPADKKPAER